MTEAVPTVRPATEPSVTFPRDATTRPSPDTTTRMWLQRPTSDTTVVHVTGDLDMLHAPRLDALLAPRLTSTLRMLVVDLSQVTFLGVDALRLLATAHHHAESQGKSLRLVAGPPAVDRALLAGGLADIIDSDSQWHGSVRVDRTPRQLRRTH